jgi:hypothetical protein
MSLGFSSVDIHQLSLRVNILCLNFEVCALFHSDFDTIWLILATLKVDGLAGMQS